MSADASAYDAERRRIESLVGPITGNVWYEVIDALDESHDGVIALAERIHRTPNLDSPAAVFISCIRAGDHMRQTPDLYQRPTRAEVFRRLFTCKVDEMRDVSDWDDNRIVEFALDYAVSYTDRCEGQPYPKGETVLTLEDEMRVTLNRPRPVTGGARRERMGNEWKMINACRYDKRIGDMLTAMLANCAIPDEPTHAEARDCRDALMAEIVALGVEPRGSVGRPPHVDGWSSIGEAISDELGLDEPS